MKATSSKIILSGMLLSSAALAEDTVVKTAADTLKIGGEFRSELLYDNHQLEKGPGMEPEATTELQVQKARIKLSGKINPDTDFAFRFNLLDPSTTGPLEYGWGKHWLSKNVGFSMGRQKVLQGSFDLLEENFKTHAIGAYEKNLAFAKYQDMAAVHVVAGGALTLQLFNDVVRDATYSYRWNEKKHLTWVLGYRGSFGPIEPMVNFGSYDNSKSKWVDVGIKTEMAGMSAHLNYYSNSESKRGIDAATGKAKAVTDVGTSISAYVAYELKGKAKPWLYVSKFDKVQGDGTGTDLGGKDRDYNKFDTDKTSGAVTGYKFDDNAVVWGTGVDLTSLGKGFTPYLAVVGKSGQWLKDNNPAETKSESKSQLLLRLGVLGEI